MSYVPSSLGRLCAFLQFLHFLRFICIHYIKPSTDKRPFNRCSYFFYLLISFFLLLLIISSSKALQATEPGSDLDKLPCHRSRPSCILSSSIGTSEILARMYLGSLNIISQVLSTIFGMIASFERPKYAASFIHHCN